MNNSDRAIEQAINDALLAASLAPSAHNTQPWAYIREGNLIRVLRSIERTLGVGDPTTREACLSIGMFIKCFELSIADSGYSAEVTVPFSLVADLEVAFIEVTGDPSGTSPGNPDPSHLLDVLQRRQTNRGLYEPSEDVEWLDGWKCQSEDVELFSFTTDDDKSMLADLVGQGVRLALSLPAMRDELASLVHWKSEPFEIGMPLEAMSGIEEINVAAPKAFLASADPKSEELALAERYRSAPVIVVLSTVRDDPQSWIETGRECARILLRAAQDNLAHCIAAGPIEIPTLAPLVRAATGSELRPQLLFRVGRPLESNFSVKSPRIPWRELEIAEGHLA